MKAVYPVIFTLAEHGYVVFIPDLNINTEGYTISDALAMARDAIGLWGLCQEDAGWKIPDGSPELPIPKEGEIVTSVDIDFSAYRQANNRHTLG